MNKNIENEAERIVEEFASMEHRRWSNWQEYLHSRCTRNEDGSLTIPAVSVTRWERQIATPYSQLTEVEKESDRKEVRPYIEYATAKLTSLTEQHQRDKEAIQQEWFKKGYEDAESVCKEEKEAIVREERERIKNDLQNVLWNEDGSFESTI